MRVIDAFICFRCCCSSSFFSTCASLSSLNFFTRVIKKSQSNNATRGELKFLSFWLLNSSSLALLTYIDVLGRPKYYISHVRRATQKALLLCYYGICEWWNRDMCNVVTTLEMPGSGVCVASGPLSRLNEYQLGAINLNSPISLPLPQSLFILRLTVPFFHSRFSYSTFSWCCCFGSRLGNRSNIYIIRRANKLKTKLRFGKEWNATISFVRK